MLYNHCFLTFRKVDSRFYQWHVILIKIMSRRIIITIFDQNNKQSTNVPKVWINQII